MGLCVPSRPFSHAYPCLPCQSSRFFFSFFSLTLSLCPSVCLSVCLYLFLGPLSLSRSLFVSLPLSLFLYFSFSLPLLLSPFLSLSLSLSFSLIFTNIPLWPLSLHSYTLSLSFPAAPSICPFLLLVSHSNQPEARVPISSSSSSLSRPVVCLCQNVCYHILLLWMEYLLLYNGRFISLKTARHICKD